jgi:hypothetical protein
MTSQTPSSEVGAAGSIEVYDNQRETDISIGLAEAYAATIYVVQGPRPFMLKIGVHTPELEQLLKTSGVDCAAFLTASNPCSEALSEGENKVRNQSLADALASRKYSTIQGLGTDPSGKWPSEQSVLVLGMTKDDAAALGRQFRQNAIVCCNESATPYLMLLR